MKLHEIYGLPPTASRLEIEAAAHKHAVECARGMHGSTGAQRHPILPGRQWNQALSSWEDRMVCVDCGLEGWISVADDWYTCPSCGGCHLAERLA